MKRYPKLRYPDDSETDGLFVEGDVVIQEKLDGANARFTLESDDCAPSGTCRIVKCLEHVSGIMEEMFTHEIRVGGSTQTVTFYQPSMQQMMQLEELRPDWMEGLSEDPNQDFTKEEIRDLVAYAQEVVDATTDIDRATIEKLNSEALTNISELSKLAINGETPDDDSGDGFDEDPLQDIEMDHSGRVDLEEMR